MASDGSGDRSTAAVLAVLVVVIASTVAVAGGAAGGAAAAHDGGTVHVDPTNAADPAQDGSRAHPFGTIQAGVDHANVGDTVLVEPGVYDESVVVHRSVRLLANGSVTVRGESYYATAITVTAFGAAVEGFTVQEVNRAIDVRYGGGVVVANNTVVEVGRGIWVDADGNTIRGNHIRSFGSSIYLYGSSGNTVTGNVVFRSPVGLDLLRSNDNHLTGNVLTENRYGVRVYYSDANVLTRNVVSRSQYSGVTVRFGSSDNQFSDNVFENDLNVKWYEGDLGPNAWNATQSAGTNVLGGDVVAGNVWAKPDGTGHSQTCPDADADGLCDTPREITAGNVDHLPLVDRPPNRPPEAAFVTDSEAATAGVMLVFDASTSTDPDGIIVSYAWTFGDGSTATTTVPTVEHTYVDPGDYGAILTVTDDEGATASTSAIVHVNAPPTASFTTLPVAPTPGQPVSFDASSSSDPDGIIVSYAWTFGDGTSFTIKSPTLDHRYMASGDYLVTLTVTDDDGATDTVSATVTVNQPPRALHSVSPTVPIVTETVTFDASSSYDPDGIIISYAWTFGDGLSLATQDPTVERPYDAPGDYPVTLTVTDDHGATATATATVTVVTPVEATRLLAADVEVLGLSTGPETALTATLGVAADRLERSQTNAALAALDAFEAQVDAQTGQELTAAEAAALLDTVHRIAAVVAASG